MNSDFYAHSTDREDKQDWQSLPEHLITVGLLASQKAACFGAAKYGEASGLLHDIGKYTKAFQARLEGGPKCNHSTWGAILAKKKYHRLGTLLAYAIAGHHTGLMNGIDSGEQTPLSNRLKANLPDLNSQWESDISLPKIAELPDKFEVKTEEWSFQLSFLTRMIFSCLVDADFIDTERFYAKVDPSKKVAERDGFPSLEALKEQLEKKLATFKPNTDINKIRCDILNGVRNRHELAPGLFSLNVPTGGGKTLTSLAFALDHAIKHNLRRVIYVIPFTSIIEQNVAVFREALGELGEAAVLEHHSAFNQEKSLGKLPPELRNAEREHKLRLAMENWEAPIIVTTSVQFFESLYANRSSRCRKLHNIANSVVILDEVQVLPTGLLRPCVAAMDELARNYHASLILCTATQPTLGEEDGFKKGLQNVRELAPNPQSLHKKLERFKLKHIGTKTDDELASEISQCSQALCIVNNRRHARVLSELVEEQTHSESTYHLTTLMCAEHRSQILKEIAQKLSAGLDEPCRIVSTSLIEAGVDLDLGTVFRAEAGLDSIVQAGGRCNRNGKRDIETSELRVFGVGSDWATPTALEQCAQVGKGIIRRFGEKALSIEAMREYFSELHWQTGENGLDSESIMSLLRDKTLDDLPFDTLSRRFNMIKSHLLPIIIPYNEEAEKAIDDLQWAENIGGIAKRLQRYLVQIPEQGFHALRKTGVIQPILPERFGEQFVQLTVLDGFYDEKKGFSWDNPDFLSVESQVP